MASECYSVGEGVDAVMTHKRFTIVLWWKSNQAGHLLDPNVVTFIAILQQQQVYVFGALGVLGDIHLNDVMGGVLIVGGFVCVYVNGESDVVAFKLTNLGEGDREGETVPVKTIHVMFILA